ncbi:MAG: Tim44 domain-containing protein [Rhodoferax sp.]|nr:Tim44 domain-containing protein [Rhodoferax sp.]
MKTFSLFALILSLVLTLGMDNAEAKRLGGGQSSGMQRQNTTDKTATPGPSQSAATPTAPAGAAATPPKRSWMGPLAGLAAGLGLAALASHLGFGEGLANMLMIGLLVMAVVGVIAFFMRKRATPPQAALAGMGSTGGMGSGMPYANSSTDSLAHKAYDVSMPAPQSSGSLIGSGLAPNTSAQPNIPADFDVAGFVRNAKAQFLRLQAANDSANLDDLREFTTPEMFGELSLQISERMGAVQRTDVLHVDAEVVQVEQEATRYVVSVRFTGSIREDRNAPAEAFEEIWHLTKPRSGNSGWMLAGIQQVA